MELKNPNGIKGATEDLQKYWNTYDSQKGYENYSVNILLNDALYGIGIAIDKEKYSTASGYDKFKKDLLEILRG